jgi:hypothetical protein
MYKLNDNKSQLNFHRIPNNLMLAFFTKNDGTLEKRLVTMAQLDKEFSEHGKKK